jgi:hypothetical protein
MFTWEVPDYADYVLFTNNYTAKAAIASISDNNVISVDVVTWKKFR